MFRTNAPCKALVTGYYEFSKQPEDRFELRKINSCNLSCLNCIFRLDPLFYTRMNHIHIRNFLVHSFIILSEVLSDGISFFFGLDVTFTLNLKSTDITKLNCYNNSILDSTTLVNIMNLGNELYSMVSRLCRQHYLLLTELPAMVTEDIDYYLMFSESYNNDLHFSILDEDIHLLCL